MTSSPFPKSWAAYGHGFGGLDFWWSRLASGLGLLRRDHGSGIWTAQHAPDRGPLGHAELTNDLEPVVFIILHVVRPRCLKVGHTAFCIAASEDGTDNGGTNSLVLVPRVRAKYRKVPVRPFRAKGHKPVEAARNE